MAESRELQTSGFSADTTKVPHTLLLADDSVTIQRVIELTFADEDVKVVAVSDGDQAIARLDAQPPDIVLADVGMPGKNGYEVAQYIKQSPRLSHIPVVLLTGAFEPVDQARAAQAGCDGVLAKPFEPQLVIGRVRELLGQAKAPAAAAHPLDAALAPPPAPAAPWTPPLADAPLQAQPQAQARTGDLTNYFDRLDAAFANLSQPSDAPAASAEVAPLPDVPPTSAAATASAPAEIDWMSTPSSVAAPLPAEADQMVAEPLAAPAPHDIPLSYASPPPEVDAVPPVVQPHDPVGLISEAPHAPQAPEAPAFHPLPDKPVALPPLADAFAALLAAERGDTSPNVAWPTAVPAPAAAPPSIDAIADQVTARVLDRISPRVDQSVREAVADLVSQLAERLIREEIEKIRAAIK